MKKQVGKNKWLKGLFFAAFSCFIVIMGHSAADAAETSGFYEYYTETNEGVKIAVISKYNGVASELTIPSKLGGGKVTKISSGAFAGNDDLVKVTLPGSVTSIGDRAFSGCSNLKTINLGKVEHIGAYAFFNTALKSAQMTSIQTIDKEAFKNCASLATVNFGTHEVLSIAEEAFQGCTSLRTIRLPEKLTELNTVNCYGIFADCTAL